MIISWKKSFKIQVLLKERQTQNPIETLRKGESRTNRESELNNVVLKNNVLPPQYFAICDEAVSSTENVLTPYGGQQIGVAKDSFNYHLSLMRQCIERAFAVLVGLWGIFWRELTVDYDKWPLIVQVCCKLHNLRIKFINYRILYYISIAELQFYHS